MHLWGQNRLIVQPGTLLHWHRELFHTFGSQKPMARADKITDPALRRSFLERVEINREIVQEHENVMRET